jgi:DNA-directed RNA polymerase subunit alpha
MMDQIILPSTTVLSESGLQGSYAVEPLFPGYGSTLGVALRRVLLSSLEGAAVDTVQIDGVEHEFSTIPHVREDVVQIILNLKQLRFQLHTESAELVLSANAAGVVTATAFKANADCSVVNTDQVIATLDAGAKLEMRITVIRGRGYIPVERKNDRPKAIGLITVDSIFSPVAAVSYRVESTRVGQMTNFDKLIIDITTDGSLTPRVALDQAAVVLRRQFAAIAGVSDDALLEEEAEEAKTAAIEVVHVASEEGDGTLLDPKTKIEDAGFSTRTANALVEAGYKTLSGLKRLSELKLQGIKGLGTKGLEEVREVLARTA